jgi:hypothetical protein
MWSRNLNGAEQVIRMVFLEWGWEVGDALAADDE